jgi:two-component system cell cycle sensor histidine kinase/response regulator CckA
MDKTKASEIGNPQMHLLLVANGEADSDYLSHLLTRAGDDQIRLDRVQSAEEAMTLLGQTDYDLLLCDYKSGDGMALRLLHEMREGRPRAPVIFLSDHVDETTVAAAINAGAFEKTASPHESSVTGAIHSAIDVYCKERQRQKAEVMLRKLWRAVEQSADLVVITDRGGMIEFVNPAFEALTGYSREEAIGHNLVTLQSEEQAAQQYQQMWQTILAGNVFRGILVNRKKNGETFVVEKHVAPLRDDTGEITHFIFNDRDITERRRLESELQQAQKMDAIGRLAGGVAHDFNNLLMIVSAYAELMLDALAAEHPLRHNVQEILTASRSAADLTRQLLAFGRKQMQSLQVLDLNRAIREINRMLPRLIGEDIQLEFVPGKDLGKVKADPIQIEQVLMNLAANARDAMPNGGKVTIETANVRLDEAYVQRHAIVPAGDYVLLAVTDSGQGIAPQHVAHIFEPFYTTKEEGKGTGLGLATVYGIVKQNGGFIWVYSEPGLGTTFKIYLPRVQKEAPTVQLPKLAEESPRGCETLLLVEDEAAVRQASREFLTLSGYNVLEAKNGEDALRVARDYLAPIDLMITDVVMPHLGGARLAEQLAVERPAMKALFVSGYAENTVLRRGMIDVTTRFLQKPFSLKALARKIREVLETEAISETAVTSSR